MYVYYENFKFGAAFYTHRITVHEKCSRHLRETLVRKYGSKAVSKINPAGRVYVRETMRIARVHKNRPRTPRTRSFGEWHFATVRNFALNLELRIDYDDQTNVA